MAAQRPIILATRGSALALAQARLILDQCRQTFPDLTFLLKLVKTTGDKQLTASLAQPDPSLPKGLFTKELELALLDGQADLAVHSLKDLPTTLPAGLVLGAVSARADVRDVLIYRDEVALPTRTPAARAGIPDPGPEAGRGFGPGMQPGDLPDGAVVATSSTRRKAQLLQLQPRLRTVEIRGNVLTRLRKLVGDPGLEATILAAAGLERLQFQVTAEGLLTGEGVPPGLRATLLSPETLLPCVGQAALGIEIRQPDDRMAALCQRLNHAATFHCVTAERAFLHAMGGGCQSPVGALAQMVGDQVHLRVVSFLNGQARRAEGRRPLAEAVVLGEEIAGQLRPTPAA
jgi:hydroxymethylbilane synthase